MRNKEIKPRIVVRLESQVNTQTRISRKPRGEAERPYWMEKPSLLGKWSLRLGLSLIAAMMLFPFLYVVGVSFSSYKDVVGGNLIIWPANPTLEAYEWVFSSDTVVRALGVSIFVTLLGTFINLALTISLAFALSRRGVPGRNILLFAVLFTMLFSPGIIPKYLVVKELGLIDNLLALILPGAISAFNLIVVRNFFINVPDELIDSARIDGANDLRVLWSIVLPLSKAVISAIGLFYGVSHWNAFFNAALYLNDTSKWPIQLVLRQVVLQGQSLSGDALSDPSMIPPPPVTIQMAVVVIATIPILLVYPFLQKYFTKGVLTGSIKG
jgi:putative aldouronate transport system permease protein